VHIVQHPEGTAAAIGAVGGFAGGLLGVGGAFVMVPAMTALLGWDQRTSQATALGVTAFAASAAAIPYVLNSMPPVPPLAALAFGGLGGAVVGARAVPLVSQRTLRQAFGATMLALVPLVLVLPNAFVGVPGSFQLPLLTGVGLIAGALSGFLGIGSGTLVVPALMLIAALDQPKAQAISLLAMIPTAAVASSIHLRAGFLRKQSLTWVVGGALAGGPIGGVAAVHVVPNRALLLLLVSLLLMTGIGMLRSAQRTGSVDRR
jgi:uncharacterized protein